MLSPLILSSAGYYYWRQAGIKDLESLTNSFYIPLYYDISYLHEKASPKLRLRITALRWDLWPRAPRHSSSTAPFLNLRSRIAFIISLTSSWNFSISFPYKSRQLFTVASISVTLSPTEITDSFHITFTVITLFWNAVDLHHYFKIVIITPEGLI